MKSSEQETTAVRDAAAKPKIAVISTYDELCGIAGYTKALVPQLEADFDVTVFDLDQFLLRHRHRRVIEIGDAQIKSIAAELPKFECVNVQLEHGTLGATGEDIFRRLQWLLEAAPRVCITFHTMIESPTAIERLSIGSDLLTLRWTKAFDKWSQYRRNTLLSRGVYALLRKVQKHKPLSAVVHTRRDKKLLQVVEGLQLVYDHPLAFHDEAYLATLPAAGDRSAFPQLKSLPEGAVLMGCFGFVSRYKGIDTAIRALRQLPENYHLAVFGGTHPNEIKRNQLIDPYMKDLFEIAGIETSWTRGLAEEGQEIQLNVSGGDLVTLNGQRNPRDLSSRIHFMGALSDAQFANAMQACEIVLLPYVEVGQSSSGPMSVALNLRRPVVASRTRTFMQLARYEPEAFHMFDVGNHVQLAQIVRSIDLAVRPRITHGVSSNLEIYAKALFQEKVAA